MFYSAITFIHERVCAISQPLSNLLFMELTYAILLTAIGSAITFNAGASSGGTDIVALILKKLTRIDVGKALLLVDCIVAVSAFFVFNVQIGLLSLLGLFAKAFIVDGGCKKTARIKKDYKLIQNDIIPLE